MGDAAQQHKRYNKDVALVKSNQQHGANQGVLQNMHDWSERVNLADEDAKLARQRASSGHSMECESSKKSAIEEFHWC